MANLTRIKNNQITDSTILANTKIVPGSIVGSLFNSNLIMTSDVTITGNLTVQGASTYLTVASTNTYINDPLIVMNNAFSGTNTYDLGLVFNRGTSTNQAFIWSEAYKEFRIVATTETGTTYGNIAATTLANLSVNNLNITGIAAIGSITSPGALTAANLNVSGNVLASTVIASFHSGSTATFGNISAVNFGNTGAVYTGASINVSGNVLASTVGTNYITASTATFGNISAVNFGNTGAVYTGDRITVSLGANIGNIVANTSLVGTTTAANFTRFPGALAVVSSVASGTQQNEAGNIGIIAEVVGNGSNRNAGVYGVGYTAGAFSAQGVVGESHVSATGDTAPAVGVRGYANDIHAGGLNVGLYGDATNGASNYALYMNNGNIFSAAAQNWTLLDNTAAALSIDATGKTGILVVKTTDGAEGVTMSGTLAVSGNIIGGLGQFAAINSTPIGNATASTGAFTTLTATTVSATGNIIGGLGQFAAINSTPIGNATASTGAFTTLTAANSLWANASIATTTQGTGAIVVPNGGISVGGAANIALGTTIGGAVQLNSTLTAGGAVTFTNTTNSTAINSGGALTVQGGAAFAKDVWVGGNLYVANIISQNTTILAVQDPLLYLTAANAWPYTFDIGMYSHFYGNGLSTLSNVYQHTGVVRDYTDNTWKFFSNVAEPNAGLVTFDVNTVYDPIKAGNLSLVNLNDATSTNSGALIVAGGAGIGHSLYARDLQATVIGNVTPAAAFFTTINSTGNVILGLTQASAINNTPIGNATPSTGVFTYITSGNVLSGFIGNTGTAFTGSSINITGNISSAGAVHNALTINGATGISGNIIAGLAQFAAINSTPIGNATASTGAFTTLTASSNFYANASIASTSAGTGAVVIPNGGVGIAGNIFQGGAYFNTSSSNFIIAGTPTTVDAFKAATTLNVGANSGTLTIGNPTVVGTQSTQNLYNTVATTVNFAGVGNVTMGAPSGVTTISGGANVQATTSSEGYDSGALVLPNGGLGVNGNVHVHSGYHVHVGGDIAAGTQNGALLHANGNANTRISTFVRNLNSGTLATSGFLAAADNYQKDPTSNIASTQIIDIGITSSTYSNVAFSVAHPNDGFINVNGGHLVQGTQGTGKVIKFYTGGSIDVTNVRAKINDYGLSVNTATVSTNITSGALVVNGGVGVASNIWIGNGAVINSSQTSDNFVVQGAVTTSLIVANSNYGALVFGGSNVNPQLGAVAKFNSTDTVLLPVGTTAQRPSNTGNVDVQGMLRYNTTRTNIEYFDGSTWQTPGTSFTVITDQQFNGDNTTNVFTLSSSTTTNSTMVSINGVLQIPTLAYSVTGTSLTFTESPALGDIIDVRTITTTATVTSLVSTNGYMGFDVSDASTSYANITAGTSSATVRVSVNNAGIINVVNNAKIAVGNPTVNTPFTGTPYVLDTFVQTKYTSAKYIVSAKRGTANVHVMEALVVTDGVGNAFVSTTTTLNNGYAMGALTANVLGGNVQLYYTVSNNITNANVNVYTTYLV